MVLGRFMIGICTRATVGVRDNEQIHADFDGVSCCAISIGISNDLAWTMRWQAVVWLVVIVCCLYFWAFVAHSIT